MRDAVTSDGIAPVARRDSSPYRHPTGGGLTVWGRYQVFDLNVKIVARNRQIRLTASWE